MKSLVLYIHGKGGDAAEAEHYRPLFPHCDVLGFAYQAQTPWDARVEFPKFFRDHCRGYDSVTLIANSIGAFFALHALADQPITQAFFISPVVDMERLITTMMQWASVTEDDLRQRQEIPTDFGETLSWAYLCDVREHPVSWHIPTHILYGGQDNLTSYQTISAFAHRIGATLTVLPNGEHWFHTDDQMRFLDDWIQRTPNA